MLTPPKLPYTGEGFQGEKWLAFTAVALTIASSILLIHLSLLQRKHTLLQIEDFKKKNGETPKA